MISNFRDLWITLTPEEKRALADKAETSVAYLSHIANGQRGAGAKTIRKLVLADGRLSYETFLGSAENSAA